MEVLRGPQGTQYGASAFGGTLKFISKQPKLQRFGGSALAEVSTTDHGGTNTLVQGVLNVPLAAGVAAVRLGVQSGKDSGYIDRVDVNAPGKVLEKGINRNRWDVFKANALIKLGADRSLSPALFAQRYRSSDIDSAYTAVGDCQSANVGVPLANFQTSKIVRENSDYLRPGYFTSDFGAGLNFEKVEVTLLVKNLGNNRTVLQRPSNQGVDTVYRQRPRTIGLTLNYTM